MENECKGCRENCCKSFLIYKDLIDPVWWEKEGKFILEIFEKNINGRFSCINFDEEKSRCNDYENRPSICKNTGENGLYPNNKCRLKTKKKLF